MKIRNKIRAVTVCVDYDDILQLTLPRNIDQLHELVVVTSPTDTRTASLVAQYPDKVRLFVTDAFYRRGAKFNKGLAIEEAFDFMGRDGWHLVMDADIILPPGMLRLMPPLQVGRLYSPTRRILEKISDFRDGMDWSKLPKKSDRGHYGYFQLFHAHDPVLVRRPWYGIDWLHAGGCDNVFQLKWPQHFKIRPGFDVLHLGPPDRNWFGRATDRLDGETIPEAVERLEMQSVLRQKHGWDPKRKIADRMDERLPPE